MELVEGALFIGTVIIGITELIKYLAPNVNGAVTIAVALVIGVVVALLDTLIGVKDISVAQGIMIAFGSVGVTALVKKV